MEKALVDKRYILQKFPGKGGWTYAEIPEIPPDKKAYFGWVRVKGFIDEYEIRSYHLMPMGNGHLFLPVKAEIRKKIKKQEGDSVRVVLYKDDLPAEIPEEFLDCLKDEPAALDQFNKLNGGEKKAISDWIYSAKKDQTRVERIVIAMDKLKQGLKVLNQY